MYHSTAETALQLARERHAQLRSDWQLANADRPDPVQTRGRLELRRLRRPWIRLLPTNRFASRVRM